MGSLNLLYKYVNQGRAEADRSAVSPRAFSELLLARPQRLAAEQRQTLTGLMAACPEMDRLAGHIRSFARLLSPAPRNAEILREWITAVREDGLPHLHAFTRGLDQDRDAVESAVACSYHNGGTEGVNTRSKLIKGQIYGRVGFPLLHHRILLG
ncbi:hypothetical protein GCM10009799_32930 [Nocardiopsis rhodophaea]|uniref:Transposase IS204/IS1001/IS1096/IS1165 DDE domain-containing protein n=1 Tax=Nocardiopsis rhodophaea TaxID=280238 RepID=A0ABP5EN88_9ACTN